MIMVVGLGNPGREYANTRHNVGFMYLDLLATEMSVSFGQKLQNDAQVAKGTWLGHELLLVKPLTFMNRSGQSVQPLSHFYKIPPEQMIVVFDDLDQEFGAVRMRVGGGHGGHNGIRDILNRLGSDRFSRIKVGIGRPPLKSMVADWVLHNFSSTEQAHLLDTSFPVVSERLKETLKGMQKAPK